MFPPVTGVAAAHLPETLQLFSKTFHQASLKGTELAERKIRVKERFSQAEKGQSARQPIRLRWQKYQQGAGVKNLSEHAAGAAAGQAIPVVQ